MTPPRETVHEVTWNSRAVSSTNDDAAEEEAGELVWESDDEWEMEVRHTERRPCCFSK